MKTPLINRLCFSLALTALAATANPASAEVWTYDVPAGEKYLSPDYDMTVESDGETHRSFVHYSFGLPQYAVYDSSGKPQETRNVDQRGMDRHSAAIFSFNGTVTVHVTVKPGAAKISLPLKSARILPSSYNIPCTIENGNTIVFTLNRPEKVVVIPNYDQAWQVYVDRAIGHVPASSWLLTYDYLITQSWWHGKNLKLSLSEGFSNPLIILAHPPEENAPDKNAASTLLVKPEDSVKQAMMDKYETVWFAPGVHDLSQLGVEPWRQTLVKKGQTIYLEGGSYVMARFARNEALGEGPASIRGRGVISGIKHQWAISFEKGSQVINIDNLFGVTITDRACFGIYGGRQIDDIAMIGGWHGNTDGPDYLDNCTIRNSFLMAHDDNLKINNNTQAKHIVIWQMSNAHAIMVKEMRDHITFASSVVEDVDILAYYTEPTSWYHPWGRLGPGAISVVTGTDMLSQNLTFRNIRIESPYLFRVFSLYNLDTKREYTPKWFLNFPSTSESRHSRIDGITFEDITVNSPLIAYRSLLGSAYDNSLSNIRFVNVKINGTTVTEKSKDEFFEIEYDKVKALSFLENRSQASPAGGVPKAAPEE